MKKKVLIVSNSVFPYNSDGQAGVVNLLSEGLILSGYEVNILTLLPTEKEIQKYNQIKMHYLSTQSSIRVDSTFILYNKKAYLNTDIEKEYIQLLNKIKPDIINFHSIEGIGANTVEIAKRLGYKVVITLHDYSWLCPNPFLLKNNGEPYKKTVIDYEEWGRAIGNFEEYIVEHNAQSIPEFLDQKFKYLKTILNSADLILAPSNSLLKDYIENGVTKEKIKLLANPVDQPNDTKFTKKRSKKIVFGHIAGYGGRGKGVDILTNAFKFANSKNIRLEIWAWPGAMKHISLGYLYYLLKFWKSPIYIFKEYYIWFRELKNFVHRNTFPSRITYWPKFKPSDKFKILSRFDCLVVPSMYRESFSLATAEALQLGIPVIASDKGGMTNMIKNNVNGLLFKQGNIDELAKCIELFANDEDLRNNLSKNAKVTKFNSSQDYVKKYISLIN